MPNRKQQIRSPADPEVSPNVALFQAQRNDPEAVPIAKRRAFSKADKPRILMAADACAARGDVGALLRREGIFSSHLATWREQRRRAGVAGALERKRGPKADLATVQ